jgi:hypothetical protein
MERAAAPRNLTSRRHRVTVLPGDLTDRLIDRLFYALYGLTDDEIAVV